MAQPWMATLLALAAVVACSRGGASVAPTDSSLARGKPGLNGVWEGQYNTAGPSQQRGFAIDVLTRGPALTGEGEWIAFDTTWAVSVSGSHSADTARFSLYVPDLAVNFFFAGILSRSGDLPGVLTGDGFSIPFVFAR